MIPKVHYARLAKRLGHTFKNPLLLEQALSHRSLGKNNNERLEFLGDSLLGFIIAESLYAKFANAREGDLSRARSQLVKGDTLAEIAREFELGEYLKLGEGELKSGGFRRSSILADSVEAIIGAIYLDAGMESCKACVLSWYDSRLQKLEIETVAKDPKTQLQEFMQEKKWPLPDYSLVEEKGEAHARQFVVECHVSHKNIRATFSSSSKRAAEKGAANEVLRLLGLLN